MKRIILLLSSAALAFSLAACTDIKTAQTLKKQQLKESISAEFPTSLPSVDDVSSNEARSDEQIQITTEEGNIIIFELNNSPAAEALYNQLPLSVSVENYGDKEKIFYPPEMLDADNTPAAKGPTGTLAYYEPWGNVAIYYGDCGGADGLYELGNAASGAEHIATMSGIINISAASKPLNAESTAKPSAPPSPKMNIPDDEDDNVRSIQVAVGNKTFTATLAENVAVDAFLELMMDAPLVINMSDYSGFEKVGSLGTNLPSSNSSITTGEGDIVLYNSSQIVVFYGSNSWSYTKLAEIDDLSGWKEALGDGDVTITFSIKKMPLGSGISKRIAPQFSLARSTWLARFPIV